jgi:hypothetical protein
MREVSHFYISCIFRTVFSRKLLIFKFGHRPRIVPVLAVPSLQESTVARGTCVPGINRDSTSEPPCHSHTKIPFSKKCTHFYSIQYIYKRIRSSVFSKSIVVLYPLCLYDLIPFIFQKRRFLR